MDYRDEDWVTEIIAKRDRLASDRKRLIFSIRYVLDSRDYENKHIVALDEAEALLRELNER